MNAHLSWYGIAVGSVLLLKLLMSIPLRRSRPPTVFRDGPPLAVHAIITVYNETPAMLRRCLESLYEQTRRPGSVTVIDDCSRTRDAADVAEAMAARFALAGVPLNVIRFPENRGKRHGLAAGFQDRPQADAYLCVDSDTVLEPTAVAELLKPMSRRRVHCVTGLVLAHNRAVNLLTRLIDMRYVNSFLGERVAYSRLGSVLCACGSLAVYRGWVVRKHLDDFLTQRFLGRPATFGDDRRLTYYCLTEGQSLIQPAAIGRTDVPERLGHYIRQQIRWGKSFIREGTLLALRWRMAHRICWWLNLAELAMWAGFTAGLLTAITITVLNPGGWLFFAAYGAWICAMAWLRSLHYLRAAPGVPIADRLLTFACAPLYALLNLFLLLPLRLWSLATLRRNNWGTRQHVELTREQPAVALEEDTVETPLPDNETTQPIPIPGQRKAWTPTHEGQAR
ncbi:glycosyltransferase [Streptomyces sp. NPDC051320]|uniref:glycosyltransferase n=1 Tax=Streptomyces sp. NPDC051320 TaxID=3154644 RepID=UPI003421148A